jgi:hypothetical protein
MEKIGPRSSSPFTDGESVRMKLDDPMIVISEFPASDYDRLLAEGK